MVFISPSCQFWKWVLICFIATTCFSGIFIDYLSFQFSFTFFIYLHPIVRPSVWNVTQFMKYVDHFLKKYHNIPNNLSTSDYAVIFISQWKKLWYQKTLWRIIKKQIGLNHSMKHISTHDTWDTWDFELRHFL